MGYVSDTAIEDSLNRNLFRLLSVSVSLGHSDCKWLNYWTLCELRIIAKQSNTKHLSIAIYVVQRRKRNQRQSQAKRGTEWVRFLDIQDSVHSACPTLRIRVLRQRSCSYVLKQDNLRQVLIHVIVTSIFLLFCVFLEVLSDKRFPILSSWTMPRKFRVFCWPRPTNKIKWYAIN